jgi:hypothetical protein
MLIPDQTAATVVKDIFKMASSQVGLNEIVRRLNAASTLTPIDYARANGLQGNYEQGNGLWNSRTIKHILTNRTYTGDLIQGKDSVTVENTHEPLISRDVFDVVQKWLDSPPSVSRNTSNVPRSDNILRGKVICGSCNGKMQRRKGSGSSEWFFFTCINNNRLGAGHCIGMYIRESDILNSIRSEVDKHVQVNKATFMINENQMIVLTATVFDLNNAIRTHEDTLRYQYEELIRGNISAADIEPIQKEGKRLRSELRDVETQILTLSMEQEQFNLFFCVHLGDALIESVVDEYLENTVIYKDKQVVVFSDTAISQKV